jgi:HEAT repeat protein
VKPLIQILKDTNEDDSTRQIASFALEKIGTKEALEAIDKYWI